MHEIAICYDFGPFTTPTITVAEIIGDKVYIHKVIQEGEGVIRLTVAENGEEVNK